MVHRLPLLQSLLFGLLMTGALGAEKIPMHVATTPTQRQEPDRKEQHERFNAISRQGEAPLVFLGDSITEMWQADGGGITVWEKYWAPLKAANFGVAGDRTEHVLWRLDHGNFDGLKPKLVVLMIGTNNSGHVGEEPGYDCTPEQTADGIRAILQRLRAKCPKAKILLLGIFPRGEENTDVKRQRNEKVNAIIKGYADDKKVFYLDIGEKFLKPNGDLSVVNMPDMLHLSPTGYEIWADAIAPTVRRLLK